MAARPRKWQVWHTFIMWRYIVFVLLAAAFTKTQAGGRSSPEFAGCYEVASLTWSPSSDIKLIPERVELLNTSRGDDAFRMKGIGVKTNGMENFWWWKPKGPNKVVVAWGGGLGGFRGTLKRSKNGGLEGKIKEWCDSRCGYKKRTGMLHLQPIACEQAH